MSVEKQTLHPEDDLSVDIYPKTSKDQVVGLEDDLSNLIKKEDVSVTSTPNTIVKRGGNGTIACTRAQVGTQAVNKEQMEEYVEQHTVNNLNLKNGEGKYSLKTNNTDNPSSAYGKGNIVLVGGSSTDNNSEFNLLMATKTNIKSSFKNTISGDEHTVDNVQMSEISGKKHIVKNVNFGVISGFQNTVKNSDEVIVGGEFNDIERSYTLGYGWELKATPILDGESDHHKALFGQFNAENKNAVLEVGNGTDNTHRSNAFEVYKDGHAEIQTQGTTDKSVATVKFVNDVISVGTKLYKHSLNFRLSSGSLKIISTKNTAYSNLIDLNNDYLNGNVLSIKGLPYNEAIVGFAETDITVFSLKYIKVDINGVALVDIENIFGQFVSDDVTEL